MFQDAFVTSEEFGSDLEHVEVLQKKFDEFLKVGFCLLEYLHPSSIMYVHVHIQNQTIIHR